MRKANECKAALHPELYCIKTLHKSIKEDMKNLDTKTKQYLKEKFSL